MGNGNVSQWTTVVQAEIPLLTFAIDYSTVFFPQKVIVINDVTFSKRFAENLTKRPKPSSGVQFILGHRTKKDLKWKAGDSHFFFDLIKRKIMDVIKVHTTIIIMHNSSKLSIMHLLI